MTAVDVGQEVLQKIAVLRRPAWVPVTRPGDGPRTAGKFSGLPYLAAGEPWPVCPECQKPLTFFFQLDLGNIPKELGGAYGRGLLQLFLCVDCLPFEPFASGMMVRRVEPVGNGAAVPCPVADPFPPLLITGWTIPEPDLPSYEELDGLLEAHGLELDDDEKEWVVENLTPAEGEKLGGWPFWVQSEEYPTCPVCQKTMRMVFQLDSEKSLPFMFGDAGIGHVTQCPDHLEVVAFGWACY